MRLTIGAITATSQILIAALTLMVGFIVVYGSKEPWLPALFSDFSFLFVGSAIFTLIAFVAFPKRRRGDVVKAVICLTICLELLHYDLGGKINLLHLMSTIIGAYVVFLASFLERLRTASRNNPREPFSLAYKGERRRSRSRSAGAAEAHPFPAE